MNNKISLEQSLKAYQVMHSPAKYSWKQHWANEKFSSPDMLSCSADEQEQFRKRLRECAITMCPNIKARAGVPTTLEAVVDTLTDISNKSVTKTNRKVIYSSSNGERPTGDSAYDLWNGWQVIDMDIKDNRLATKLKAKIFKALHKCNWFMGVTYSASGMGLHIYTKIAIPETINVPTMEGYQGQVTDTQIRTML